MALSQQAQELKKAYLREWRKNNKEKIRGYQKTYYQQNKEKWQGYQENYWNRKVQEAGKAE
jgi:hypothetical protein